MVKVERSLEDVIHPDDDIGRQESVVALQPEEFERIVHSEIKIRFSTIYTMASRLQSIMNLCESLATGLSLNRSGERLVTEVTALLGASRATFFLLEPGAKFLHAIAATGVVDPGKIVVELGQGVVGQVAETGKPMVVNDAYSDVRFTAKIDANTGFRTRNLLAVPIFGGDGSVIGVLQAINKKKAKPFTPLDRVLLNVVSTIAGVTISVDRLRANLELSHGSVWRVLQTAPILSLLFMPPAMKPGGASSGVQPYSLLGYNVSANSLVDTVNHSLKATKGDKPLAWASVVEEWVLQMLRPWAVGVRVYVVEGTHTGGYWKSVHDGVVAQLSEDEEEDGDGAGSARASIASHRSSERSHSDVASIRSKQSFRAGASHMRMVLEGDDAVHITAAATGADDSTLQHSEGADSNLKRAVTASSMKGKQHSGIPSLEYSKRSDHEDSCVIRETEGEAGRLWWNAREATTANADKPKRGYKRQYGVRNSGSSIAARTASRGRGGLEVLENAYTSIWFNGLVDLHSPLPMVCVPCTAADGRVTAVLEVLVSDPSQHDLAMMLSLVSDTIGSLSCYIQEIDRLNGMVRY